MYLTFKIITIYENKPAARYLFVLERIKKKLKYLQKEEHMKSALWVLENSTRKFFI